MATNSSLPAISAVRDQLERMTPQFAMVMPRDTVDRFKRVFVTMLNENPDLFKCTPQSLIACAMRAAQDGLDLDGREAACVPFRDGPEWKAQYVPMVLGLRKKVRATGLVSDWTVHVVFEGDEFDIAFGDRPYILHKPALKGGRTRPVTGAYSIATFKDGTRSYEFMNIDEIEDVRSKSKARSGPWSDRIFYPEMCRKTVARLHAKQLPQSSDLVNILRAEDEDDAGSLPPPQTPPPRKLGSVAAALDEFGSGHMPLAAPSVSAPPPDSAPDGDQAGDIPPPIDDVPGPDSDDKHMRIEANEIEASRQTDSPEAAAYQRGKDQKARGHTRKAIPPEYREPDRTREALAWQAGYDGTPLPTWGASG